MLLWWLVQQLNPPSPLPPLWTTGSLYIDRLMKWLELLQLPVKRHTLTHTSSDGFWWATPSDPRACRLQLYEVRGGSAGGHGVNRRRSGGVTVLIDDLALIMTFNGAFQSADQKSITNKSGNSSITASGRSECEVGSQRPAQSSGFTSVWKEAEQTLFWCQRLSTNVHVFLFLCL